MALLVEAVDQGVQVTSEQLLLVFDHIAQAQFLARAQPLDLVTEPLPHISRTTSLSCGVGKPALCSLKAWPFGPGGKLRLFARLNHITGSEYELWTVNDMMLLDEGIGSQ